jgi:hypothetical protein
MKNWWIRNHDAITWFIIGWLSFSGLDSLANGQYMWAAISAVLIYLNYKMIKVRIE